MRLQNKRIIAVIGQGRGCTQEILSLAEQVGKEIAKRGGIVICGGLQGVMEAVCKGAKFENGLTIGVIPGTQKSDANKFVDLPIVTGLGEARNSVIVRTADIVIAVGGKYGTLSEISFALAFGKPVIGLNSWENIKGIIYRDTPFDAVEAAFNFFKK